MSPLTPDEAKAPPSPPRACGVEPKVKSPSGLAGFSTVVNTASTSDAAQRSRHSVVAELDFCPLAQNVWIVVPQLRRSGGRRPCFALLRFVRVAGMHLFQVDGAVVDEEPDAGSALERWLVLPALVGFAPAGDGAEFAS